MIHFENLNDIQKALCVLVWELDSPEELKVFVSGLPDRLKTETETLVELFKLSVVDRYTDTDIADELMRNLTKKRK